MKKGLITGGKRKLLPTTTAKKKKETLECNNMLICVRKKEPN